MKVKLFRGTAGSISRWAALLSLSLVFVAPARLQAQDLAKPLGFGIVPQQAASRLSEDWAPLLAEFSRRAGLPQAARVGLCRDCPETRQALEYAKELATRC